ncbi:MAG TPA: DNA ligase D [Acidobacteriaceae bacterium]|nr:DNA ligase D [Acidobacteriaceae bacterium]
MPKTKPKSAARSARRTPARGQSRPRRSPSAEVDRQLARYRAMRDFEMTAEPRGGSAGEASAKHNLPFVIQKHAATRLHYDFRLGWRGVLRSWAVARGPSSSPADKRLAVEVEDHPVEYGGFEGTIPRGQYGGGTVMVWDQGTWEPFVDVDEGLRQGNLKFALHGQKLHGRWVLVRMHGNRFGSSDKPSWLLIKEHDEFARTPDAPSVTDESPNSAVTGRTLNEIAAAEDHVWDSSARSQPARKSPANRSRLTRKSSGPARNSSSLRKKGLPDRSGLLKNAPKEKLPGFIAPQLATTAAEPPEGDDWLHELKLDGYRIQIHIDSRGSSRRANRGPRRAAVSRDGVVVRLYTRKGLDWTNRMKAIAEAAARLPVQTAILDGEAVVLNAQGGTSFADLQAAFDGSAPHRLTCFAFDLLHLDGHNLRVLPLEQRKTLLEGLFQQSGDNTTLRYSSHIRSHGAEMFRRACQMGAEGVVSKRAHAPWRSGRAHNWLKAKCFLQQEFVVGGFTPHSKDRDAIGALLLGYYDHGRLICAGRTGTGFDQKMRTLLRTKLAKLRQSKAPFDDPPAEARKEAVWVKPQMVVEVRFSTWTASGNIRQAAFLGLREDKDPGEVTRESPQAAPRSESAHQSRSALKPTARPALPRATHSARHAAPRSVAAKTRSGAGEEIAGVRLTHPDRILDEPSHLTKRRLAEYYAAIADHMLPHIAGRPLSLVRCPEGSGKPCFFQKHVGMGVPAGVHSVPVPPKEGGAPEQYLTLSTEKGLVGLAQMGVLEIHPWGSRNDALETPDRFIIDLDPDPALPWLRLVESAREVRRLFNRLGLESFVKSTGGRGLHVVAPIQPEHEWPAVKNFAHSFVLMMERAHPKLYLTRMAKAARTGRIFLDYLRNERGATAVAPFSPRARAGARVSIPLAWAELGRTDPRQFSVANFSEWKSRLRRDPWLAMDKLKQRLTDRAIEAVCPTLKQSA